ncbi:Ras GTPase activating protein ira2 [Physocladia obscura]|uniref:Ras GTPase activating protein ira2 n=1 Tax=Physocladia obscura TaxID=109957 RepID=A0AAD5T477_9FUNG|nr:Ras GTPase activating protein ira2 [Physocladia obscura]
MAPTVQMGGLTSDIRLLRSIVTMLTARLPINSGTTLGQLEGDGLFTKNIRALIELCPWRLWDVLGAIGAVLEAVPAPIARAHFLDDVVSVGEAQMQTQTGNSTGNNSNNNSNGMGNANGGDGNGNFNLNGNGNAGINNANTTNTNTLALQSQLFVLRLMANCLAYYWRLYRDTHPPSNPSLLSMSLSLSTPTPTPTTTPTPTSAPETASPAHQNPSSTSNTNTPQTQSATNESNPTSGGNGTTGANSAPDTNGTNGTEAANVSNTNGTATDGTPTLTTTNNSTGSSHSHYRVPASPPLSDPPALDEPLANYLLNIVSLLLVTSSADINVDTISHPDFLRSMGFHDDRQTSPIQPKQHAFFTAASPNLYLPNPHLFVVPTAAPEIYLELQKEAGKIIFYLSASNWSLVINRLRSKIYSFTAAPSSSSFSNQQQQQQHQQQYQSVNPAAAAVSGIGDANNYNDNGIFDLTELRYLEFLNLNLSRLPVLLTAIGIRKSIFNWIDTHPQEFIDIHHNQKRIEGSADAFFATILSLSDVTSRRRFLFWPAMMSLLVLVPDLLLSVLLNTFGAPKEQVQSPYKRAISANATGTLTRTTTTGATGAPDLEKRVETWLENVRKAVKNSKYSEVAIFCFVDLLNVFAIISKSSSSSSSSSSPSPLSSLPATPGSGSAPDYFRAIIRPIDVEIRERLFSKFDGKNSIISGSIQLPDGVSLDYKVPADALYAIMKLNPFHTLRQLLSGFFNLSTPGPYRVILIRACYSLVFEDNINGVDSSLAAPIRALFMAQESVRTKASLNFGHADEKAKKPGLFANQNAKKEKAIRIQAINGIIAEHFDLVYGTLKMWAKSPSLVVIQGTSILNVEDLISILHTIVEYASYEEPHIRAKAGETLRAVFAVDFISVWDGSSANWRFPSNKPTRLSMQLFWMTSSAVLGRMATLMIAMKAAESGNTDIFTPEPVLKGMLELLRDLLKARTEFLHIVAEGQDDESLCRAGSATVERAASSAELEKLLLVLLCSPSNEIVSIAIACIGHMVEEMDLASQIYSTNRLDPAVTGSSGLVRHGSIFDKNVQVISMVQNIEVYRELCTLNTSAVLVATSRAMQRRVRTVISKLEKPSTGCLSAAEEIYSRWRVLFRPFLIKNSGDTKIPSGGGDSERQNYTAFLCAMGGPIHAAIVEISRQTEVIRPSGVPINAEAEIVTETAKLEDSLQILFLTAKMNITEFITDLQSLMIFENDVIREYVKNFLGTELNSGLFDILFSAGAANVTKFLGSDDTNQSHERNIFFVESFISVLKLILERQYNEMEQIEFQAGGVDVGSLILSFVKYLNSVVVQRIQMHPTLLRIRTKVCQLVEIVISKKEAVALRQEIQFKNKMLVTVLAWNSEIASRSTEDSRTYNEERGGDRRTLSAPSADLKLSRDLDLASMRALVAILDQLPIQLTAETAASLTAAFKNGDGNDSDFEFSYNEFKGHEFYNSLYFFLRVLDKCRTVEALETKRLEANSINIGEYNEQLLAAKETLAHIYPLKDLTIRALSNLLAANIDIGLKYSLSLGYHEDPKTRASFMLVLTNLLETGGKVQFNGLGEEVQVMQHRYNSLVDMISSNNDLEIALALGSISDVEDIAPILVSVFETKGQLLKLITAAIEGEVDRTDFAPDLFRQNSMATRLLTVFSKAYGKDYLIDAIKPVLDELLDIKKSNLSFEIDPNRIHEGEVPAINRKNVATLVNRLLDNLLDTEKFPKELRVVCSIVAEAVGRRFPDNKTTAVGAFMFLRFINPIIVTPWTVNVTAPIQDRKLVRGLVLATKVIQNLANNLLFNIKEPFMFELNELLQENHGRVIQFLKNISETDESLLTALKVKLDAPKGQNISEYDLIRLHRALAVNLDKVEVALTGSQHNWTLSRSELSARKAKFAVLSDLLTRLEPAPEKLKVDARLLSQNLGTKFPALLLEANCAEFISRVQSVAGYELALDAMRDRLFFYESGISKEGNKVIYFIARRVKQRLVNMEILLYHLINVLAKFTENKFELVVDVTQFSVENEWDVSWISRLLNILPTSIKRNLGVIYVYRCNSSFARYAMRLVRSIDVSALGSERVMFVSDEKELTRFISTEDLMVPKSVLDSDKSIISKSDVTLISHTREHTPLTLRLSSDFVHLTLHKRYQILGMEVVIADVIKFIDVIDVVAAENSNEFSIKYAEKVGGIYGTGSVSNTIQASITLSTSLAAPIVQSLKQLRNAFRKTKRTNLITEERTLRPNDVPGTLLNMAVLNMGSHDSNLRVASYNLLYALSSSFGFKIGRQLVSARGLSIPENDLSYVKIISQQLASSEKHLTIEFLIEFLIGFSKSNIDQKIFGLEYLDPWLRNLSDFIKQDGKQDESMQLKLKSLIKLFAEATIKESELFHLIQERVWVVLGTADELVPDILDIFIQTSIDNGIGSIHTSVLTNTLLSVAAVNSEFFTSHIVSKLLEISGSENVHDLVSKGTWTEVSVLIRFMLVLSFDEVIDLQKYLPDIFHIITLVVGNGQAVIRSSIHGVAVNLVHTLCAKLQAKGENEEILQEMLSILKNLSGTKFRAKFGVVDDSDSGSKFDVGSSFVRETTADDFSEGISPYDLKDIATELVKVVTIGCGRQELVEEWKERWFKLVLASTFDFSYVQSRTFITLGALSRSGASIDLLFRCLSSLMGYLSLYDESEITHLNVSITTCIIDVIHGLPKTPQTLNLLKSFFWVAMGLIQISDVHIFAAGASLVKSIIEILDDHGEFKEQGFAETLTSARGVFLKLAMDLDDMTGIWFSADFSFAFTANVLKGLKSERTRGLTVSLLKLALDVSGRNPPEGFPTDGYEYVADHCAGFIVPLLPIVPCRDLKELFMMGGVDEKKLDFDDWAVPRKNAGGDKDQMPISGGLFDTEETNKFIDILERMTPLSDENRSILMLTLLVGVLEISESESESVFIYGFLAQAALQAPEQIFFLYESLLPRMNEIVTGQASPNLISSAHSIFQTMMALMPLSQPSAPHLTPLGIPMRKVNTAGYSGANDQMNNLNGMLNNINSVMGGFGQMNSKDAMILQQITGTNAGGVPNGTITSLSRNAAAAGGRSTSPSLAAIDDDDMQFQEDASFMDTHTFGIGNYPLSANQQLLSHLQTLGFVGVASANSFNGAGLVQQKQIATMVVQLIRVILVQLQSS